MAQHPYIETHDPLAEANSYIQLKPWLLTFDKFRTQKGVGVGVTITSPDGKHLRFIYQLKHECSNNQVEYEALIAKLRVLASLKTSVI